MARADEAVVYGAGYSVYTRIARMALEGEGRRLSPGGGRHLRTGRAARRLRQAAPVPPAFPAFEHGGLRLYETSVITRYVDEAFAGPALQPEGARDRARMNQAIAIMDAYGYRTLVWDIFVERERVAERGGTPDEARIAAALPKAATVLRELEAVKARSPWIAGENVTLADLHVAPMLVLFQIAPEGSALLSASPNLAGWLAKFNARPAALATRFPDRGMLNLLVIQAAERPAVRHSVVSGRRRAHPGVRGDGLHQPRSRRAVP